MPFSAVLIELMNNNNYSNINLVDICEPKKIFLSVRNIQRYKTGEVVPSFELAKEIISCFKEEVKDKDLKKCLTYSRIERDGIKYHKKRASLVRSISIDYNEFHIKQNSDAITMLIQERVNEKYPDSKKAFSYYIRDLISDDINKNVLKK